MKKNIGIVGAGTAGLHLGLRLLARGHAVTLYSERDPAQDSGRTRLRLPLSRSRT